jgi:serine/threonine protein kinase
VRTNPNAQLALASEPRSWLPPQRINVLPPPATLPPNHFSFKVNQEIGRGGLGVVDEIEVTATNQSHPVGRKLARKRLGPQWAKYPEARERFEREIAALNNLSHPNIITVQAENIQGGERFYCMPLCETSYRRLLEASANGFVWSSVARLGAIVASALEHAHSKGHFHRDLKPENLLYDKSLDRLYVADWGIGYFIHEQSVVLPRLTVAGGLGTVYYCSLEQWAGVKPDAQMDIYSLGILLAELVMGRQIHPFSLGQGISIDVAPATSVGSILFNQIVRRMTSMAASQRHSTMAEVVALLQAAITAG